MNWLTKIYKLVSGEIGKILSAAGAALLSIDVAGYGDTIRTYAGQYLGANAVKKIGIGIFVLLAIRTAYTGWKGRQLTAALVIAQASPQPQVTVTMPASAAEAIGESVKTAANTVPTSKPVGAG
jgi:hypothetical protein